ncbi:MAG: hypothetical protein FWD85_12590 [Microbacteriaceae bacterium]|nr:hypothetical protein [Microbacteriaceae bacterium]MCL2796129.1 hypothetical protein [Microbacteriaceae bacterium]
MGEIAEKDAGERMPRRRHRRVTTDAAPGSDPEPAMPVRRDAPEEASERSDSNDERLKRDVPPHW